MKASVPNHRSRSSRAREASRIALRPICQAIAIMIATGAAANAHAAGMVNLGQLGARMAAGGNAAAGGAGVPNLGVSPQQALQASKPSIQNLGRAASVIAAQVAAQQAAAAAGAAGNVPNGLGAGGLQVAPGVSFVKDGNGNLVSQNTDTSNSVLWINANGPQQSVDSSGHVNVDVKQTGQNAVVTWQTMNVGKQTTLNFDQSGGTQTNGANNWAVLNRINDPSGLPSQILGNVKAQGSVYVINRNGILFGAGSQVNVHSLVASSLDFLNTNNHLIQTPADIAQSNVLFLQQSGGLAGLEAGQSNPQASGSRSPNEVLGLGNTVTDPTAGQYQTPGAVMIAPGASITTATNGTASDGGFVLVAAPSVTNAGSITATGGQVILAAGVGVGLTPNPTNPQVLLPELTGALRVPTTNGNSADVTPAGSLVNTGIVQAARGNVTLLGSSVAQNGVVAATTSVNQAGSITISTVDEYSANTPTGTAYTGPGVLLVQTGPYGDPTNRAGQLIFGNGSLTTVLPDTDGATATSSPGTTFTPGSITMKAGSVWLQSGSLIEAPGSTVSITALTPNVAADRQPAGDTSVPGRIYLDTGAIIDVSGLANVELPISSTLVTVPRIGQNELADSPLLRNSFLFGLKNVVFDSTLSGTNADGLQWVGSPILNLSGYVSLIPRSVDQLLTNGGTINLAGAQVMTASGSSMNLNGGYIHYDGGVLNTTRLVDANGVIVPIGQANPSDTYVGIAGQFIERHPRWNITTTWSNPLLTGGAYQADYIVGGNAGTLNVFASDAMVLNGDISAQAFGGSKQVQGNAQPTGGAFTLGVVGAQATQGAVLSSTIGESGTVILQGSAPSLDSLTPGFSNDTPLNTAALATLASTDPNNVLATKVVPVDTLSNGGFAKVSVAEDSTGGKGIIVAQGAQLTVQPGGSITLSSPAQGSTVNVLGNLVAPSGTINISSSGNITVGPDALISAAGQWVNNDTQSAPGTTSGNSQFINGGSITLSTVETTAQSGSTSNPSFTDVTGSIDLQQGSVLDVSSGGEMLANGQMLMQNGIARGRGGNVSLLTYTGTQFGTPGTLLTLPGSQPTTGSIAMDGTIKSEGFSGGGTLTLQALGFQVGGDPTAAPAWDLLLPANFFSQQGFGKYVLNAFYDATIEPGTTVALTQLNRVPNTVALQQAVSGADLGANGLTTVGVLDPFHRQPTSLVMTAGSYLSWLSPSGVLPSYTGVTGAVTVGEGASIHADAGASVGLGSPAQVTVLGSIVAPGGTITLSGDTFSGSPYVQSGQLANGHDASPTKSVWVGADALLDVSGVALTNPLAAPVKTGLATTVPTTGKVLAGGSVNISDDSGVIVAQAGSTINVSGTSATFDEPQASGVYAPQSVWSDAGSITLVGSSALYFDGTLKAQPGAAQAQGGTLTLLAQQQPISNASQPGGGSTFSEPGASLIALQQSGSLVPAGLAPGQKFDGTQTGVLQFSVDRLDGSGISTLVLGSQNSAFTTVPVAFVGNVDLNLGRAVSITSGQIVALSSGQLATLVSSDPTKQSTLASLLANGTRTVGAPTVTIDAPYVVLNGPLKSSQPTDLTAVTALADGTLNINASFIDLGNQVQLNNFAQANFTSSGDIRLSSTTASIANGSANALETGELYTAGNLTFKAADIYPSTGSTFIIDAVGPNDPSTGKPVPTTVTFLPNGTSGIPLSAGGSLIVDANQIVQSGTVRAPSGSLVFGVGDPTNTTTVAQFKGLPIVATDSVMLGNGSVTSVSNDGAIIPFGTTVDGVEWQFNPIASPSAAPDLTAPPAKFIGVNGSKVALNPGASIDLSGGGDLQAAEWVPGTGGSRDVLSQYNVSYASTASGVALPVNANAGNVYAILPGAQSPVAAYDPMFAQSLQPSTNANGTVSTTTLGAGVGQAALNSAVGQSVYLSGVPGLAAGVYTLLPGKYATLPGAYRVTLASAGGAVTPTAAQVLPDGTAMVAGCSVDALSGARSATPTLFDVQSGKVWQQYSQYTLTGANQFFPQLASSAGKVTPLLPVDGGQLALAAINALTLGATLNTAAGTGGAPAEVDIASKDIQITGNGGPALAGYLQIGASDLDSLNAGSLLIGGTRAQTGSGITITPIADSVVVSNNASSALSGPEVLLVTKTDPTGTDPNAANGLRVDAGSVIAASGNYPAAKDVPITIGQLANSATSTPAISGDGALLRVSNGASVTVSRLDTSGTGVLTVGAGATLTGGQSLTLDSSGDLKVDPTVQLSGKAITAAGSAVTFTNATGADAANLPGFVIGAAGLTQLANAQQLTLRSLGAMNFVGDINATFGNNVDLSAGTFNSDGGSVTLNGATIAFTNEAGAAAATGVNGSGTLTVNAKEIDLGTGNKIVSGFGNVTMNATGGIVGQNTGTFDFGTLPVTLNAPVYLADTSSASTVKTSGALTINGAAGTALTNTPLGGAWSFIGGTVNDNAKIAAPAGNVSLEATSGDLTIGSSATVSSAGVSKAFFDVTEYAPAGAITLTADTGSVNVQSGSTLDFSGASGGGAAGSLTLSAPQQVVNLNGTLKGGAATGFAGGSFSLDTGGAVNLDNLAHTLASSGVNSAISVQVGAGNLTLSAGNTLTAHQVALTADGGAGGQDPNNGHILISGVVNASGKAGGQIELYGNGGVDIEGKLLAIATTDGGTTINPTQRGGTIDIGTSALFDPANGYNAAYGYENMLTSGAIKIGAGATLDVSGGTAGGLSGGTINFRAPLLSDNTVNVTLPATFNQNAGIFGSRNTTLEAYAVWSTTDATTGAKHFDGIVDPAGWYGDSVAGAGQPGMVAGTWKDQSGNVLVAPTSAQQLKTYLANDFFTPTTANADHQSFYGYVGGDATAAVPGTLMSFVESGLTGVAAQFATTNVANFHVVPGIELDNPSTAINNGDISVLTNWNLGAGASQTNLAFRFNGQAPDITFRAVHDVQVDASLTDGFFQIVNPTAPPLTTITIVPPVPKTAADEYAAFYVDPKSGTVNGYYSWAQENGRYFYYQLVAPAKASDPAFAGGNANSITQYYGLYQEYLHDATGVIAGSSTPARLILTSYSSGHVGLPPVKGQPTLSISVPTAAQELADPTAYLRYLSQYDTYAAQLTSWISGPGHGSLPYQSVVLQPPPVVLTAPITPSTVTIGSVPTDNTPSPVATSTNGLPLVTASLNVATAPLNGGSSSSFRVVSGADLASANPLSVQAVSMFKTASGGGDVTLDGHFAYVDTNNVALLAPTMIRTGTGSIDIAAGNSIALLDSTAPGVIYTAGAPAVGTTIGNTATIVKGNTSQALPDILVSPTVNPDSAGDISIHAQGDITGIENATDATGSVTGVVGANISQFWWQWMQITGSPTVTQNNQTGGSNFTQINQTSIDFGAFGQGVMSVGGNVSVSSGGNITDLAVSLPTTWYLNSRNVPVTVGGGNLAVTAGGSILSGDYFVAKGTGTITAGAAIASDGAVYTQFNVSNVGTGRPVNVPIAPVSTLLATQDGTLDVSARQGADIGGVYNPSYVDSTIGAYSQHADFQSYSPNSAVNIVSTTGDVKLGTLGTSILGQSLIGGGNGATDRSQVLPASIGLTAFSGGITIASGGELFPSATGNLNLLADQSINVSNQIGFLAGLPAVFGMLDVDPSLMPSPANQMASVPGLTSKSSADHAQTPLHADDNQLAHIYSVNGSIVDGVLEPVRATNAGFYDQNVSVVTDKPTLIQAGQDIVNLAFLGQNLRSSDFTRIVAGRDIYDTPLPTSNFVLPSLVLGGPGTFDVEAGRNIGPLSNQQQAFIASGRNDGFTPNSTGIDAVGNANNPNLPHESANVQVLFGVGPGIDIAQFISAYIAPASASVSNIEGLGATGIAFMQQYDAGLAVDTGLTKDKQAALQSVSGLTGSEAWAQFKALPSYVQQQFVEQVFFKILTDVGNDYNNPASHFYQQYARGYQAINTLFPASLGYTANNLGGGANGANTLVKTGNLDIRSTTIQTQQGGNVTILGPGGEALVGSVSAPPAIVNSTGQVLAGPSTQGILTLEKGDVNIFTDESILLAQSRIFTEQGGNMTIWSSNGDINAGKGSKSVADVPAPNYVCDVNHYCTVDARGEVTGAGIATLQTIPGVPVGDATLVAPRGTVDAGDAGIRVSGTLNVAALHVANADNIQAQQSFGVPVGQSVNTGVLTSASSTASAANQMAQDLAKNNASGGAGRRWMISVEVEGFGDNSNSFGSDDSDDSKKKRKPGANK